MSPAAIRVRLLDACETGDARTARRELDRWQRRTRLDAATLQALGEQIEELDRQLFGNAGERRWDGKALAALIRRQGRRGSSTRARSAPALPPMYPD
ncbi:MAG: hypothetical protein U5R48_05590 [Gammaproteobacteria bacterium]|nr:hypothetical protein [Gammaproteobacteria bacterium]